MLYIVTEGDRPEGKSDETIIRDVMEGYISVLVSEGKLPKETEVTLQALEAIWPECYEDGATVFSESEQNLEETAQTVRVIFQDNGLTRTQLFVINNQDVMLEVLTPCFQLPLLVDHFVKEVAEIVAPPAGGPEDRCHFEYRWLETMVQEHLKKKLPITERKLKAWALALRYCRTYSVDAIKATLENAEKNLSFAELFNDEEAFNELNALMTGEMVKRCRDLGKAAAAACLAGEFKDTDAEDYSSLPIFERIDRGVYRAVDYLKSSVPEPYRWLISV